MSEDNSKDEEKKVEETKASAESTAVESKEDETPQTAPSAEKTPEKKEETTGLVEIRQIFRVSKLGNIAGCMVLEGIIRRNASIRL